MIICRSVHPVERRFLPVKNSVNTAEPLLNNLLLHQLHPPPLLRCLLLLFHPRPSR